MTTNTGNIFEKIGIGTSVHYSLVAIDVKDLNDPPHAFILNTGADPIGLPNLGSNGCLVLQQNPGNTNYTAQIAFAFASDKIAIRRRAVNTGTSAWTSWRYFTAT